MLTLDICNYSFNKLCNIYDSSTNFLGNAHDVVFSYQRNGWKTFTFTLPSMVLDSDGSMVRNPRLDFVKADYLIRAEDTEGTFDNQTVDYYVISEPKLTHEGFATSITVTADHLSSLLRTKQLDLVFSDTEGNNVGTAEELLTTILEGTGWQVGEVATFYEKGSTTDVKVRSLVASDHTGAFALITKMCQLFDAKPIFNTTKTENGEIVQQMTVDIVPMNPFSEQEDEQAWLEELQQADTVLELHYGHNIKNIQRTESTENIVTRLYAYGSYGDTTYGYCGIDELTHKEWVFNGPFTANVTYYFEVEDSFGISRKRYFKPTISYDVGTTLIWSDFDPASRMYLWCPENRTIVRVKEDGESSIRRTPAEPEDVPNLFSSVMDFSYYDEVGLLSDTGLLAIATYQRDVPDQLGSLTDASAEFSADLTLLSSIIGSVDFCKLQSPTFEKDAEHDGNIRINFEGLEYTSQYLKKEKDYFTWRAATGLLANGDPINTGASVVYIVRDTSPLTYEKYYFSEGSLEDKTLLLYCDKDNGYFTTQDRVFVFSSNNVNGYIGALEASDEAAVTALENATKLVTVEHPTYFDEGAPDANLIPATAGWYGWYWEYAYRDEHDNYINTQVLYFAVNDSRSDIPSGWIQVLWGKDMPAIGEYEGKFFYNWRTALLYYCTSEGFITFDENYELSLAEGASASVDFNTIVRISQSTGTVLHYCLLRDQYYKGQYQNYDAVLSSTMPAGNYAMESNYGVFWLFTTEQNTTKMVYDTTLKQVSYDGNLAAEAKHYSFPYVNYHPANAAAETSIYDSIALNPIDGSEVTGQEKVFVSGMIRVYENLQYKINLGMPQNITLKYDETMLINDGTPANARMLGLDAGTSLDIYTTICFYDEKNRFIENKSLLIVNDDPHYALGQYTFTTPMNARYIKISTAEDLELNPLDVHYENYSNTLIADDETYTILQITPTIPQDEDETNLLKGIIPLTQLFADTADQAYHGMFTMNYKQPLTDAQLEEASDYIRYMYAGYVAKSKQTDMSNALGYIYREGWWQENSYVNGDEEKLYRDALETLHKIARPEVTFNISFVDNRNEVLKDSSNGIVMNYQDITSRTAAHLIDDDNGISQWAFIDKISRCYDKPWETQIQINTDLTTMSQHTFNDVFNHIAEVANTLSGMDIVYSRAMYIGSYGKLLAEAIEGQIDLDRVKVTGASSTCYQDERGNWILEASDDSSALMLSGGGIAIASAKDEEGNWQWQSFGTGEGFSASLISTGTLNAKIIHAGAITTEMLAAPVGSELNVYSNKSVRIVASEEIEDTDFSSGKNLLRGAVDEDQYVVSPYLINNVKLPDGRTSSKNLTFQAHVTLTLNEDNTATYVDDAEHAQLNPPGGYVVLKYTDPQQNDSEFVFEGVPIMNGWSKVTVRVPKSVEIVSAWIYSYPQVQSTANANEDIIANSEFNNLCFHSPKVEWGELPTAFTKCPDDLECEVKSLQSAVIDVRPSGITSTVKSETIGRNANLYSELYDELTGPDGAIFAKNIYHGFTAKNYASGSAYSMDIHNITVGGNYTVSFYLKADTAGSVKVTLGSSQPRITFYNANTWTRVVAPCSNISGNQLRIIVYSTGDELHIHSLMVERGLVASSWVASSEVDAHMGANLLPNGGFSDYTEKGHVDENMFWMTSYCDDYVCNGVLNNDKAPLFRDSNVNTLYMIYSETGPTIGDEIDPTMKDRPIYDWGGAYFGVRHVGVKLDSNQYYTFSCYVNSNMSSFLIRVLNGETEIIREEVTEFASASILNDYHRAELTFYAKSIYTNPYQFEISTTSGEGKILLVAQCKLEKGVYATTYTEPGVSLATNSINTRLSGLGVEYYDLESRMSLAEQKITDDAIINLVQTNEVYRSGLIREVSSSLEQTAENYRMSFQKYDETIGDLNKVTAWFNFSNNAELEIGRSDSDFTTSLSNEKLAFKQKGSEIAYISNSKLYITQAEILATMQIGNIVISKDASGSLNWTWKVEEE